MVKESLSSNRLIVSFCCRNLKESGPGRAVTFEVESCDELGDEKLKIGDAQGRAGNSVPTEMSVSLSESNSESVLRKLELKAKK